MTLGERIKAIRGNLSRDKFAPQTGISKTTLVNYETGERIPTADYLLKILEQCPEISPAWLLTGEGEMKRGAFTFSSEEMWLRLDLQAAATQAAIELLAPDIDGKTAYQYSHFCIDAMLAVEEKRGDVPPLEDIKRLIKFFAATYELSDSQTFKFDSQKALKFIDRIVTRGKTEED